MDTQGRLSGRERQIMDIVYALGEASATQVLEAMPDAPTRTSVRTFLRILEEKGHLTHRKEGREFVFCPTRPRERVGQSALQKVLRTFFAGSIEQALAAHLADRDANVSPAQLKRLEGLIRQARAREKQS